MRNESRLYREERAMRIYSSIENKEKTFPLFKQEKRETREKDGEKKAMPILAKMAERRRES